MAVDEMSLNKRLARKPRYVLHFLMNSNYVVIHCTLKEIHP